MKFKFNKNLDYQIEAINAVAEIFETGKNLINNKETFELHHSIPLEEDGEDKMDNIIFLCTACHKQAHWIRTYFYKYLKPLTKEETP